VNGNGRATHYARQYVPCPFSSGLVSLAPLSIMRLVVPYPWKDVGRYEAISYTMDHLKDLSRNINDSTGNSRSVIFRYNYHCFTDSSKKAHDFRHRYTDSTYPGEERVFCPKRWLLSRDLVNWLGGDMSKVDLVAAESDQWVWNSTIKGIDKPYCIFFRFGRAAIGYPLAIEVKSAYVRGGGRIKGRTDRFISVLKDVCGDQGALAAGKANRKALA
jgi:hypothetical protein